jgi:Sulfotransferase family
MSDAAQHPFFFVHVMKTGGATFRQHIYANFGYGEVYPVPKVDDVDDAWLVEYVLGQPEHRRASFRAYTGHFPFVVTELLPEELMTLTLVRDPIARTISYLKHCKRYHDFHQDLSLEQIYQDEFHFKCFIHNHQTKIFSMTVDDKLESYMDTIEVDDRRLDIAMKNLEKVDVLGLTERYPEFLEDIQERFGWHFGPVPNRRVGTEKWEASAALRERIASDNVADMALYEHATRLYEQRRRAQVSR